jgi:hypothetical protein
MGAVVSAGTGAAEAGLATGAVVFLAGVRVVFFADAVVLAAVFAVALVFAVAAAGRTFAPAASADGAGEVAGVGTVTGIMGRGGAVAVKTSLDRAKKASAGSAEAIQPNAVGRATASCAVSDTPTAATSRVIG